MSIIDYFTNKALMFLIFKQIRVQTCRSLLTCDLLQSSMFYFLQTYCLYLIIKFIDD